MSVISASRIVSLLLLVSALPTPYAVAQERTINDDRSGSTLSGVDLDREPGQLSPPAAPLPWAEASIRGAIPEGKKNAAFAPNPPGPPSDTTVVLPLSAGLSIVSLPLRVPSEKLSDIFPNLPEGSRAWTWDVSNQNFVEGFDKQLPLGHACWLYVPVPVLLVVTGKPNLLQDVSVDLENGWNLIGVPYGQALLRSRQHVYVDWARKPLNDAIEAKEIDPSIFSYDVNGYDTVTEDGSFEPLRGYWVYASRAELLELQKPGFSDAIGFAIPWGTVLNFVGTTILTDMGYGDSAKLNKILAGLDTISQTQVALNAKLDTILTSIQVSKTEILQRIGDSTYVAPVQVALLSHYDEENPKTSLGWFVAQAKAGTGPSVTMATKSDFARQVLNDWKFIDQFNLIRAGISPMAASNTGLLDNFSEYIVLTSGEYDLKQHYQAMEAYYSTLLGMQIKCATLIMGAYDQLANDPASTDGYTAQTASTWKKNVFDPAMKEETERFLHAVESLAVAKLPVPQAWTDPAVRLPDNVQVVLGLADLYFMETLKQIYPDLVPPGVRVRFVLNPGAGADLPSLAWVPYPPLQLPRFIALPSIDTWRTYAGARDYDDWTLPRHSNTRAFSVTPNWKVTQVILPVTAPVTLVTVALGDSDWWINAGTSSTVSATLTESQTPFGSITFAARPSTNDVFDPCKGWPITTAVTNFCWSFLGLSDCDRGGVDSCNRRFFHPAKYSYFDPSQRSTLTMTYEFTYQGDVPKASTWKANGDGAVTDNTYCVNARYYYELLKGKDPSTVVDSTVMDTIVPHTGQVQTVQVTWEPGQIYTSRVRVQLGVNDAYESCLYYWTYQGAQMTFP